MDNATRERQELEITALKSIYEENFFETPPPKAWKKPIEGLKDDDVATLSHKMTSEAQKIRGMEMVFEIVGLCQDWMETNIKPKDEVTGSLAVQMTQRAQEEERVSRLEPSSLCLFYREIKARKRQEAEEAERAAREALVREEEFKEEALRQLAERELQYKARKRANSESTMIPSSGDTMTESFPHNVEVDGVTFNTVRLFHPRQGTSPSLFPSQHILISLQSLWEQSTWPILSATTSTRRSRSSSTLSTFIHNTTPPARAAKSSNKSKLRFSV
ncbi:hypothetical protein C0993_005051 [Termitomyces sp. T159_Od127]|nr:hypothetical protein C0993_005051 [Termitomyces sp. T159_Od127]